MEDLFACAPYARANIVIDGQAEIANAFISSGNYYRDARPHGDARTDDPA